MSYIWVGEKLINVLVQNIYHLLADPNVARAYILATPLASALLSTEISDLGQFMWFLSLVISLTRALLATLLQQWACRYLTITQPLRDSPHERAPIRAFFLDGVVKFHLHSSVDRLATPVLVPFLLRTGCFSVQHRPY
jgi:Family of unknown function (DUF6535)